MGRAYYCFGREVALRMSNGQAFGLRNAELGAHVGGVRAAHCFLRGNFSFSAFRGLVARGVLRPNPALVALPQPVALQLNMKAEAAKFGKDAVTLQQVGRRLDLNQATDEVARQLLLFDEWRVASVTPAGQKSKAFPAEIAPEVMDASEDEALSELVTRMAGELWLAAETAGQATQPLCWKNR